MTTFDWRGGNGAFGTARLWSPHGVPGAGDTARIASGDVAVSGRSVGATVDLGGTDSGAAPAMELRHASIAALTMPNDQLATPDGSDPTPSFYGTVNVRGQSSIGSLEIGAFESRSATAGGHDTLFAKDNLTVNVAAGGQLDTSFDLKQGSMLTVNGGERSGFGAGPSTIEGGNAVILAPLVGQGTITLTDGAVYKEGYADAGTLELGGRVNAGQTIDINAGTLLIDKPAEFAGTLNIRTPQDGGHTATDDAVLRGLDATSYSFDDATHALSLFLGDTVLDKVQFSAATTAASFKPGSHPLFAGGLDVFQTTDGVLIRGTNGNVPSGATELPTHTTV